MAGSTDWRILWAGVLAAPLILLGFAGAVSIWPERVVGVMDAVRRGWTAAPAAPGAFDPGRLHRPIIQVPPPPTPPRVGMLRGTVRTPDGEPFRGRYTLGVARRRMRRLGFDQENPIASRSFAASYRDNSQFVVPIDFHPSVILVFAEGYAPKVIGPYGLKMPSEAPPYGSGEAGPDGGVADAPPDDPEPVEVVLEPGVSHEVRVVDAQGAPILGAEVAASLVYDGDAKRLPDPPRTNEDGRVVFPNLSEGRYEFEVTVHAFRYPDDSTAVDVAAGGSTTIALDREPKSGVALDEEGRPVADVVLLVADEMDDRLDVRCPHFIDRIVLGRSDSEGRFRLPALHQDSTYLVRAEGPGESLGFAPGVRLGGGDVKVTLRPMRTVRGIAPPDGAGEPTYVMVKRSVPTGFAARGPMSDSSGLLNNHRTFRAGPDGRFEYSAWGSVDTELFVAGQPVPVPWPPPREPIRVDVPTPPATERPIRLHILAEPAIRPVHGAMTLYLSNVPPERAHQDVTRQVEIRDDAAEFRCLSSESFRFESDAVPGYWTSPGWIHGGGPYGERMQDVRIFAGGSIVGRVLEADGSPVGAGMKVTAPLDPEWAASLPEAPGMHTVGPASEDAAPMIPPMEAGFRPVPALLARSAEEAATDADGRFEIPAFPLNVLTSLVAERGRSVTRIDEIRAAPRDSREEVELRLPRKAGASVRVVDPGGRPISGGRLTLRLDRSATEHYSWPFGETDADGRCSVDDLAEGESGYSLVASFAADFRPIVAPLIPGGPTLELRAERGEVLEGRVVEAMTDWPIPNLALYARPAGTPVDVEVRTDSDGRFRISTLPPGPVQLEDRRGLHWVSPDLSNVRAGSGRPVVLRVIELRSSDPQPRPIPMF